MKTFLVFPPFDLLSLNFLSDHQFVYKILLILAFWFLGSNFICLLLSFCTCIQASSVPSGRYRHLAARMQGLHPLSKWARSCSLSSCSCNDRPDLLAETMLSAGRKRREKHLSHCWIWLTQAKLRSEFSPKLTSPAFLRTHGTCQNSGVLSHFKLSRLLTRKDMIAGTPSHLPVCSLNLHAARPEGSNTLITDLWKCQVGTNVLPDKGVTRAIFYWEMPWWG